MTGPLGISLSHRCWAHSSPPWCLAWQPTCWSWWASCGAATWPARPSWSAWHTVGAFGCCCSLPVPACQATLRHADCVLRARRAARLAYRSGSMQLCVRGANVLMGRLAAACAAPAPRLPQSAAAPAACRLCDQFHRPGGHAGGTGGCGGSPNSVQPRVWRVGAQ